jgi:hypothetical protein
MKSWKEKYEDYIVDGVIIFTAIVIVVVVAAYYLYHKS